jgi:Polyketide cyclase / dehydrase and lipid transport
MAEVSAHAHIAAPADKVWNQMTDFTAYGQWNSTHTSFPGGPPTGLAEGSTFTENMRLMSFPAEVTWTVAAFEPGRTLELTGKGPMGVALSQRYRLTPDGDGTDVAIDSSFTGPAVSLMAAKLKEAATAALDDSLTKLAGLLA